MKTSDFRKPLTSSLVKENINKMFGMNVSLEQYSREQLEDMRNKLRTRVFQQEGKVGGQDLLTNETYQKDKAMLDLLNTRIKEMLGENIKQLRDKMMELSEAKKGVRDIKHTKKAKGAKPDFLDMDKDGDKKEPMKKAIADKKANEGYFSDKDTDRKEKAYAAQKKKATPPAPPKDAKANEGFPTDAATRKGAVSSDDAPKVGDKKKTASGGVATKTASGTVHKAGPKGYGNKWNGDTQDQAPAKPSKAAKSAAEKKADRANDIKLPAWKGNVTKHSSNKGADRDDGTGDEVKEALKGKQGNLDADKDGKLEKSDFAALRAKKVKEERTEVKDKEGKVTSWKDTGEWKKSSDKNPRGKVTNLSDKARRETEKMKESRANFKHNVRFVNESLGYLLAEDEEGKAKAITAAGDMVNDFTSWMQRVGQYQTKSMIELADAIRADFGQAEAEAFKQAVGPALSATLETLTQQREAVSNAVAVLAGEAVPEEPMGMDTEMPPEPGMDMAAPDEMNTPPNDEFGASDAAAGAGLPGREMRESKFARKLSEGHSLMNILSK